MADRVWIVLEGPDMTYYGDAEIHGVYATEAEAEARCDALNGGETNGFDNIQIQGWDVGESSEREPYQPPPRNPDAPVPGAGYLLAMGGFFGEGLRVAMSSPQTAELSRRRRWWWSR